MSEPYTTIIGLEVHVQLLTKSKLFCSCSTQFGAPPNTQTCPVCLGMPGSLPVMNRRAFQLALKTAAALNCKIAEFTKWDRKNYYYPDLPKGYQISQFDLPFSSKGHLMIDDAAGGPPKRIGIIRAHLEEDAGKSMHDEHAGVADSRVDLNRTGTPLLEIVSEPDMRSADEAKAYLDELKLLLTYLEVSDCNMQEGSLRVDANVNLHIETPAGKVATPIVEVKNMNSFRAVERALAYEVTRQYDSWKETGEVMGKVAKQTRGWDDQAGVTHAQRGKEESSDYRYFPEPDLVPVLLSADEINVVRSALGELPQALRKRLESEHGLSPYDADVLVNQGRPLVEYFLSLAKSIGDSKVASNWLQQDVLRTLKEIPWQTYLAVAPANWLAELVALVKEKKIEHNRAREVLAAKAGVYTNFYETSGTLGAAGAAADTVEKLKGKSAAEAIQLLGIEQVDESALVELCREILAANPRIVADVKEGKMQAAGALVGQAKKKNPHVNPGRVREICLELIGKM
jgi:aspartyl-tRNA(Asn)/glutamyl-tRNA(Gln) amidotransferase subunit B